jgi:O-antigen ligase
MIAGLSRRTTRLRVGLWEPLVFVIACLLVVYSVMRPSHQTRQIDFAVLGVIFVALFAAMPRVGIGAVVLSLAIIPSYTLPSVGILPGEATALLATLLAIALAISPGRPRGLTALTPVDVSVVALFVLMLGSVLSHERTLQTWFQEGVLWLGPYVCARLIAVSADWRRLTAKLVVGSAVALIPLIVIETATNFNPFLRYLTIGSGAGVWGGIVARAGATRAEASFGHPIALSMFLAVAAVFALGLAWEARDATLRRRWLMACVAIVVAQALTISRSGWVVLGVAIVVAALVVPVRRYRVQIARALMVGLVGLILAGQLGPESISAGIPVFGHANAETTASSEYRSALLKLALSGGHLQPWGTQTSSLANLVVANYGSIDNEYLDLADTFGYIPGLALVGVALALIAGWALRRPSDILASLFVASAIGLMVGIGTVAFITQQQVFVWLVVGGASGALAGGPKRLVLLRESTPTSAVRSAAM